MMRWVKRIALIIGGLIIAAVLVGVGYEQIMRWRAAREFPVQGRLIDIGGRHMQIGRNAQGHANDDRARPANPGRLESDDATG